MDAKAYQYLQEGEGSWWYRGREAAIRRMLLGVSLPEDGHILDFGAGYGAMHPFLKQYGDVDAYEVEVSVADQCKTRGYTQVMTEPSELEQASPYHLIGAFDVLEHLADDRAALHALYELLNAGGTFVATVPAFRFLWSAHDELHHHFRRYSLEEIRQLFLDAGFVEVRATYWNMTLFPVAYTLRRLGRGGGEALTPPSLVNRTLAALLHFESTALPFTALPFGTGIVVVGKKSASNNTTRIEEMKPKKTLGTFLNPIFIFSYLYHHRVAHFLFIGATGALLNLALTWFFTTFVFGQARYLDAFIIGIAGNILYNFALNSVITFRTKKKHLRRFVLFALYSLAQSPVLYYLVKVVTSFVGIQFYLPVIAGIIMAMSLVNFLVFKFFLFKETQ